MIKSQLHNHNKVYKHCMIKSQIHYHNTVYTTLHDQELTPLSQKSMHNITWSKANSTTVTKHTTLISNQVKCQNSPLRKCQQRYYCYIDESVSVLCQATPILTYLLQFTFSVLCQSTNLILSYNNRSLLFLPPRYFHNNCSVKPRIFLRLNF